MIGIDEDPVDSIRVACGLANDALAFLGSTFRSRTSLMAENLFLRKQLAFYQEHQIKPRRLTNAARLSLVFWSRFLDWKAALLVVKPATLIGWHRQAFRLFWKWKSRPGRPRIPSNLRQLIAQMVRDNPTWGEERVADELWLKLGIKVSPRTVRAYWPAGGRRANGECLPKTGRPLSTIMPESCWRVTSWSRSPLGSVSFMYSSPWKLAPAASFTAT
jgi:hypothetical protein